MSTDLVGMLARLPLERNGELSLYQQLRAAIEMAIIVGELPDGTALPSVRRLAAALDVAPVTVVQAYRDLQAEQLIRSVPKRGYFVSANPIIDVTEADLLPIQALIDEALKASMAAGLDDRRFLRLVSDRIRSRRTSPRLVAVVGQRDAALAERVGVVAQSVEDLAVRVTGLSFEELEAENAPHDSIDLAAVECFLVPVAETQRAAAVLGQHARRIVPMTRTLRADVREFIRRQPEFTRFGIIAGASDLIGRILAVVRRLHPLRLPPLAAAVDEPDAVDRILRDADALIVGSLAYPRLAHRLPPSTPSIEFVSIPDERTLQRLRSRLVEDERMEVGAHQPPRR